MSEPRIETRLIRAHGVAALAMVVVSALFGVLVATKFVVPDFLGEQRGQPGDAYATTTRRASCLVSLVTLSSPFCTTRCRGWRSGPFAAAGLDGGCSGSGISVSSCRDGFWFARGLGNRSSGRSSR